MSRSDNRPGPLPYPGGSSPARLAAVISLLSQYRPRGDRDMETTQRMQGLLQDPAALERSNYQPGHFTASALVLSPDCSSVLLVFHKRLGLWLQPGGHVEPTDASLLFAAEREVAEEVGLTDLTLLHGDEPILDLDIHALPSTAQEPAHLHFDVRFAFRAASRTVTPNHEVRDPLWVELGRITDTATDRSVVRAVQKLARWSLASS